MGGNIPQTGVYIMYVHMSQIFSIYLYSYIVYTVHTVRTHIQYIFTVRADHGIQGFCIQASANLLSIQNQ